MASFSNIDLKNWRESKGKSAADVAEHCAVDVSTYYKYENGKMSPNPDVMYQICSYLGDIGVWCSWMRTEYPRSYGRVHPEITSATLPGAILGFFAEMQDLKDLQTDIMRDGADGKIDDPQLLAQVKREVSDLLSKTQVLQNLLHQIQKG